MTRRLALVITSKSLGAAGIVAVIASAQLPRSWAQSAPSARPEFEAASVKPTPAGTFHRGPVNGPERFSRSGVTAKDLVSWAYDLEYFQIAGGPAWFTSEHYEIQARSGMPANSEQMRHMVQSLLADRFHLKLHREMRELSGYALVVAKNGSRLPIAKEVKPDTERGMQMGFGFMFSNGGVTLAHLARGLTLLVGQPVVDQTGLGGNYDVKVEYDQSTVAKGTAADPSGGPSIFTALQEQLGLRLESQKRLKVDTLVIDDLEKPSDN
jgi:uncharacterized protein (TIGR03435 family)